MNVKTAGRLATAVLAGFVSASSLVEGETVIAKIAAINVPTGEVGAPFHVIDSDADAGDPAVYHRDKFTVDVTVDFQRVKGLAAGSETFRARGQLINDQGTAVTLQGGGSAVITASEGVSLNIFSPTATRVFSLTIDPGADLGAGRDYRVSVTVQREDPPVPPSTRPRWNTADGPDDSASFTVVHFTGSVTSDPVVNVRGYPTGAGSWSRRYAVASDPDKDEFIAAIPYQLMRYDRGDGYGSNPIGIELDVDLLDDTGAAVPLANDGKSTATLTMLRYYLAMVGSPVIPSVYTGSFSAPFRPATGVVLDSVNRRYHATVTLRHIEELPATLHDDGSAETPEVQLLHFNGSLHWGSFVTTMGSVGNDPVAGTSTATYVNTTVAVDGNSGTIAGHPGLQFGDGNLADVRLFPDGHAEVVSGQQEVTVAATGGRLTARLGEVSVEYVKTRLGPSGATVAGVHVQLPQGLGYTDDTDAANNRFGRTLEFAGVTALDDNFRHTADLTTSLPAGAGAFDEARPLVYAVNGAVFRNTGRIEFTTTGPGGVEYSHTAAFEQLEADAASGHHDQAEMANRATNDGYLRYADLDSGAQLNLETVSDGSVRLSGAPMHVQSGAFTAHFPAGAEVRWDGGRITHLNGGMDPGSLLEGAAPVTLSLDGSCAGDDCTDGAATETPITLVPDSNELRFTHDGGLHAAGRTTAPVSLQWGLRGDGAGNVTSYTHRTGSFDTGWFQMAGQHAFADANPALGSGSPWQTVAADMSPASVLFAGYDPTNHDRPAYPASADYADGVGFYAGHNFVATGGLGGASRLGGATSDYPYTLRDAVSKYYVRRGGLSGRHVAEDGSFDPNLKIYGYDFETRRLQLTFLSNENKLSWFDGAVAVPQPAGFSQRFLGMELTCTGDLGMPKIDPADNLEKQLTYWNGTFQPLSLGFAEIDSTGSCYPERALVIGLTTDVAHVPGTLSGKLAFMNDGNIGTPNDDVDGADGRLGLPGSIQLAGPGDETWTLVPTTRLYFNNPEYDSGSGPGFVTFAGTMDVPYFEDVRVQVITSANGLTTATVHLTGGWNDGTNNYFSNSGFDPDHRGYPSGIVPLDIYKQLPTGDGYASGSDAYAAYRVTARQSMFGLVPLSYPLDWSISARYFKSAYPIRENKLIVLQDVFHQVDYMSPENVEVSFGAKYDGLPEFNLASAVYSAVDDRLGASEALTQAAKSHFVTDTLEQGVDELGRLVGDTLEEVLDLAITAAEKDVITPLYGAVKDSYNGAHNAHDSYNDWAVNTGADLESVLDSYLDDSVGSKSANLRARLDELAAAADSASSVVRRIEDAVDRGILAIDSVAGQLQTVHDEVLGEVVALGPDDDAVLNSINGILAEVDTGDYYYREVVHDLVYTLILVLAGPDIVTGVTSSEEALNSQLEALLNKVDPTLDRVVEALNEARDHLMEVKIQLNGIGAIITSFQNIVDNPANSAELDGIVDGVRATTHGFLNQLVTEMQLDLNQPLDEAGNLLDEFSQEEFVALLRAELRDRLLNSGVIEQFQYVLRQWVYDIDLVMRSAVDTAFSEIRRLTQMVIQEALGPLDDKINGLLGDIGDYLGSGAIDGYAQIEGDSLKRLRIDGNFQFKIPDEMEINAYLEILSFDSGDDFPGSDCLQPGEEVVEVRLGATDVGVDWISPDLRADMEVKFSMTTESTPTTERSLLPRGVGGSFEMTGGSLEFESFEITEFAAAMAVSVGISPDSIECYLAASARMEFSSYSVEGGIFFGRTCSLGPIEMINPDVSSLLGSPPFTGAYAYGEVWLPISEMMLGIPASCLFDISAGVGAGAFFFVEGPTWGGQMLLGVSGEALCVVSIKGELEMTGVMSGGDLRYSGRGTLKGKAGVCPFCIKFKESAKIEYQNGDWSIDY